MPMAQFYEWAKGSMSTAVLCSRFQDATKAILEDRLAKKREEMRKR